MNGLLNWGALELRSQGFQACRLLLCATAKCLPDKAVLWVVRNTVLRRCRFASSLFDHFCLGSGDEVTVSLKEILNNDPGLQRHLSLHIANCISSGAKAGKAYVPQSIHSVRDQRLALGSFNCLWRIQEASVELELCKKYRWSPGEKRLSQAIHRSADSLEQKGEARSFHVIGKSRICVPSPSGSKVSRPVRRDSDIFLL